MAGWNKKDCTCMSGCNNRPVHVWQDGIRGLYQRSLHVSCVQAAGSAHGHLVSQWDTQLLYCSQDGTLTYWPAIINWFGQSPLVQSVLFCIRNRTRRGMYGQINPITWGRSWGQNQRELPKIKEYVWRYILSQVLILTVYNWYNWFWLISVLP